MVMILSIVLLIICACGINARAPNSPLLDSYDYIGKHLDKILAVCIDH